MIISFYDNEFKGLQGNASLVVDNASYSLIKRGVDLDSLTCKCEPFTENIQPTFIVVKNDKGKSIYGCLAGIPRLNTDNQTVVTGSDLKTMLKSDVMLSFTKYYRRVNDYFQYVFDQWNEQVNQNSFDCELVFNSNVGRIDFDYLKPYVEDSKQVVNAWDAVFAPYLKYYGLYMTSEIDLVNKKVVFRIGKSMYRDLNIKLWEVGIYDYGKWIADVNEAQGYVLNKATGELTEGYKWILTSKNVITTNAGLRDIYPVRRKVIMKEAADSTEETTLLDEVNHEALTTLTKSMFNENIDIEGIDADFETQFNVYPKRGAGFYKSLPCGELHYDAAGLKKVQIGYRFTGLQFLL